jgi:ribosomal protein S6
VLLLDPQAEDDARAKIVADARAAIEAQGELVRYDDWGSRALTYPIDRKTAAEYHMLQFHASSPALLEQLNRSLRLADEALRFRIVKLAAGVPDPPDMRSAAEAPVLPTPAPVPAPAAAPAAAEPVAAAEAPAVAEPAPAAEPAASADAPAVADPAPVEPADAPPAPAEPAEAPAEPAAAAETTAEVADADAEPDAAPPADAA